ncbi:MAG: GTP 3',8-cyclase MoaA [Candidatus Azobacteroides sp.]|nr:GTP 3',8-cyclase MoaA [Candidatus Azobacteroides sp.]
MCKLFDSYNRVHNYLRISLTDDCNFRCIYCTPEESIQCFSRQELMTSDEIFEIAKLFTDNGTNKIRLTGGEPLVRYDFAEIVEKLARLPVELTLTTNGALLHKYVKLLKENGVKSVNISLDSFDNERFKSITKRNAFSQVWENILLCLKEGFYVKLNVVVMKGINEAEIPDFIARTRNLPIHVRFIEFMPFSGNDWEISRVVTMKEMLSAIEEDFFVEKIQDNKHDTAKKYRVRGYKGTFAFITAVSHPFCNECNRIRLTADGKIKNCLFGKEKFDVLGPLRKGEDIQPVISECLIRKQDKPENRPENYKNRDSDYLEDQLMIIKIGG